MAERKPIPKTQEELSISKQTPFDKQMGNLMFGEK